MTPAAPLQAEREAYYQALRPAGLAPLWSVLSGLVPSEPSPQARPFRWAWKEVLPQLLRAGELITAEEAERRVLVLENPGLPGRSQVTDTLYAGLQLILPGEVAPAHRHSQSALRFVLHGEGAFTAVDGERTTMRRGDFIITPQWTWHDHGHDGQAPVVWLDGLDVPLVGFLRAGFREGHAARSHAVARPEGDALARYGSGLLPVDTGRGLSASPVFSYPYERSREALECVARHGEPDPHLGVCLRYASPIDGGWAMPTIGTTLRWFHAGSHTRPYRSTDSLVLVGLEGRAVVDVGGHALRLEPNDVVAVPGWTDWSLRCDETCVVFGFSDRPVHEKLGLFRECRG